MAFGNDFIELFCLRHGHGAESEVVDNQKIRGKEFSQGFLPGSIGTCRVEAPKQLGPFDEQGGMTDPTCPVAQSLSQVGLADTGRAIKDLMLFFSLKLSRKAMAGNLKKQFLIDNQPGNPLSSPKLNSRLIVRGGGYRPVETTATGSHVECQVLNPTR